MNIEKKNLYAAAMFPMMLQAIFNARTYFRYMKGKRLGLLDYGEAMDGIVADLDLILDSFESVGVCPRFKVKKLANGMATLHHFNVQDMASVMEQFSPNVEERDYKLEALEKQQRGIIAAKDEKIARLKNEILQLKKENEGLKVKLARGSDKGKSSKEMMNVGNVAVARRLLRDALGSGMDGKNAKKEELAEAMRRASGILFEAIAVSERTALGWEGEDGQEKE